MWLSCNVVKSISKIVIMIDIPAFTHVPPTTHTKSIPSSCSQRSAWTNTSQKLRSKNAADVSCMQSARSDLDRNICESHLVSAIRLTPANAVWGWSAARPLDLLLTIWRTCSAEYGLLDDVRSCPHQRTGLGRRTRLETARTGSFSINARRYFEWGCRSQTMFVSE